MPGVLEEKDYLEMLKRRMTRATSKHRCHRRFTSTNEEFENKYQAWKKHLDKL